MVQSSDKNIVSENKNRKISTLTRRRDFLRLAANRKKWVSRSMIVQMARTPHTGEQDLSTIRVGYTASKKVGNAVKRNRAKRRLREVVRHVLLDKGKKGHDYVVIARPATVDSPFDQLIRDFSWCLKRLNTSNAQKSVSKSPVQSSHREEKT